MLILFAEKLQVKKELNGAETKILKQSEQSSISFSVKESVLKRDVRAQSHRRILIYSESAWVWELKQSAQKLMASWDTFFLDLILKKKMKQAAEYFKTIPFICTLS